jgi:Zn-dependent protease
MRWSFKIGALFGIPIRLHVTMLVVPFLAYSNAESGALGFIEALALTALLFASVVAHELGHALTARRFGVRTADIVLLPIGGVARIVNLPKRPGHEIAIAIAGPLVSLALAGIAFSLLVPMLFAPALARSAVLSLFYMNLVLGLFNLVPALPMDGGRILRGLLALKRDYLTATRIAVRIGRAIAVAGFIYAIWSGETMLAFVALFVYFGAGTEERIAWMREAANQAGGADPGPGGPFGRVYTWRWTSAGRGPVAPAQPPTDWEEPAPARPGDVVVIQGGKAEVVSRKDPP